MNITSQQASGIWSFPIILPNNPLKWLNCYVIRGERNLLIDSGFNMPECRKELLMGMKELGLNPENTDVFFTHFHSDHIGNASFLENLGFNLIMGKTDYDYFCIDQLDRLRDILDRMYHEGMDEETIRAIFAVKGPGQFAPKSFSPLTVLDGDILEYGEYSLKCIETSGHTPGHVCLYGTEQQVMFSGDHVLFDITPNICVWLGSVDSLGDYLESLDLIQKYPTKSVFPSHRNVSGLTLSERVDALKVHHQRRLDETVSIIRDNPNINAHEIAARLSWKIRARNWSEFPVAQKYFAMNETMAHLDHLIIENRIIRCKSENDFYSYVVNDEMQKVEEVKQP